MENNKDIRWIQRLNNYEKALQRLSDAVALNEKRALSDLEKQGLIQAFEFTHELAWKVMKDYLSEIGGVKTIGSRDTTRESFAAELIIDGDNWMEMIKKRNLTSHTYNEETSEEIYKSIIKDFSPLFVAFQARMQELKEKANKCMD
ncbi:MAG: nucleotidyltransferase substrate binding protein [Candidatus Sabulitectum sp.]|nr:nucleotidyltransferase substrate binding protein [Candidatus Sabulitectum sp.]